MDPLKHLYDAACMDKVKDLYGSPYANKDCTLSGFIPVVSPNQPDTIVILQCNYLVMYRLKNGTFLDTENPERFIPSEEHCYGKTPFEALQKIAAWKGGDFILNYDRMKITWLDRYGVTGGVDGLHDAGTAMVPIPLRTDDVPKEDFDAVIVELQKAA